MENDKNGALKISVLLPMLNASNSQRQKTSFSPFWDCVIFTEELFSHSGNGTSEKILKNWMLELFRRTRGSQTPEILDWNNHVYLHGYQISSWASWQISGSHFGRSHKLLNKKTIVAMQACWGYQEFGPNDPICGPYQLSPLWIL